MLSIKNLDVIVSGKQVLNKFNLDIQDGSIHVIMGPNGVGKSTLSRVIMGDNNYKVTSGNINFNGEDIKDMTTDVRSRLGIFLAMQNPMDKYFDTFEKGQRVAGKITQRLDTGEYFVTLGGRVTCKCKPPQFGRAEVGQECIVTIKTKNLEDKTFTGAFSYLGR